MASPKYDVYAMPFLPRSITGINAEPGVYHDSQSKHNIDYTTYVNTFAVQTLLPIRKPLSFPHDNEKILPHPGITPYTYMTDMNTWWNEELNAQKLQNQAYSLYMTTLQRHVAEGSAELFSFKVPGLREDTPRVEPGDVLQLRQLHVDHHGNLIHMGTAYQPPLWTGIIHNASVWSVHRASETVYVRAEQLREIWLGTYPLPLVANIVHPPKERFLQSNRLALELVDHALKTALFDSYSASVTHHERPNPRRNGSSQPKETAFKNSLTPLDLPKNDWIYRMLFPDTAHAKIMIELRQAPQRKLFDSQVNWEQAHVVDTVCSNYYGTVPFVVSGPPGTGKTKTLTEMAMQLLNSHAANHILMCAPSDAAADTLALRLQRYLTVSQLLRLNGPWRADNEVPDILLPFTYMENSIFSIPPFKQMMAYNVVVTSCRDASLLMLARLTNSDLWTLETRLSSSIHPEEARATPNLHWAALCLDEAAQATELESLTPISIIVPPPEYPNDAPQPKFVMAGDENQLGPRTASRNTDFASSLFARISNRPLYREHPFSRAKSKPSIMPPVLSTKMLPMPWPAFTNLIRNYRSHPAILSVPSLLFYNDTLIPEYPIPSTPLQVSSLWQGRKWPVLFVPHDKLDEIEHDGGGWYNHFEAHEASTIAFELITRDEVAASDICMMSPFAAQVRLLRKLTRAQGNRFRNINIGPLEAFQGLEKRVVIISTTRTRSRFVPEDVKRGWGILHQPRRMNVALTRAREALIVLGNPQVLAEDQHWRTWMAFCGRNGLIHDNKGVWAEMRELVEEWTGAEQRVGVLERALIAKDERSKASEGDGKKRRVLGKARCDAMDQNDGGGPDYDEWIDDLRRVLDQEEIDDLVKQEQASSKEADEQDRSTEDGFGLVNIVKET